MIKRQNFQLSTQQKILEPFQFSQLEDDCESSQKDSIPKIDPIQEVDIQQSNDEYLHQQFQYNLDEQQYQIDEYESPEVKKEEPKQKQPQPRKRQPRKEHIIKYSQSHSQSQPSQLIPQKSSLYPVDSKEKETEDQKDKDKVPENENGHGNGNGETQQDSNLLKSILGLRMKQGRIQYLIEKNSNNKAWKEQTLLSSKGYADELLKYNQFLVDRMYYSLYSNYVLQDDVETFYTRRYIISKGKLLKERIQNVRGKDYPKKWDLFDHKVNKKCKRRHNVDANDNSILDYHALPLNKNLLKKAYIKDCEKQGDELICTFWYDGKLCKKKLQDVQDQFPKELAIHLYNRLKQKI